ncbi:hypothetical protein HOS13_gp06 [Caulobacter phage Lullwater]|uniref:Uncharacterized protein n=1 Tax=Caulobacter phage Lullwater TaxID=2024607 RepID=A0A291LB03_9CAUD|nr:hypothetical protein HOS13_gp06 [Caulobacter phage Lullwater]ATI16313.1 hypothetical protein Lull_006 [Caulobacter phage Lullwater]
MAHPLEVRTVRQHLAVRGVTLSILPNGSFSVAYRDTTALTSTLTGAHMAGLKLSPHKQDIRRRAMMAGMNDMIAKGA